jgi:preprotein translocase subunit SecF
MAIYFRTWKMSVAALVALLHDMIFTVGIYALTGVGGLPGDHDRLPHRSRLLSLYDTVVVFDKVRENTTEAFANRRTSYAAAANLAVNQTLVRSINTTVVALLPIAAVLVLAFTARSGHAARPRALPVHRYGRGRLLLDLHRDTAAGHLRSREPDVVKFAKQAARHEARSPRAAKRAREEANAIPASAASAAAPAAPKPSGADAPTRPAALAVRPAADVRDAAIRNPHASRGWRVHADRPEGAQIRPAGPRNQPRRQPKSKR